MNEILQFCQSIFSPLVIVFTVSNLFSMGLQVNLGKMIKIVGNPKFLGLTFGLGWVIGPAIAYLITLLLPLDNGYIIVLFIGSLAPCAPFLPPLLPKAHGDIVFAGAFIPVAAIGTALLMPIFAPLPGQGDRVERNVAPETALYYGAVASAYWRFTQDIRRKSGR